MVDAFLVKFNMLLDELEGQSSPALSLLVGDMKKNIFNTPSEMLEQTGEFLDDLIEQQGSALEPTLLRKVKELQSECRVLFDSFD